jgi:hypothetical protein
MVTMANYSKLTDRIQCGTLLSREFPAAKSRLQIP